MPTLKKVKLFKGGDGEVPLNSLSEPMLAR